MSTSSPAYIPDTAAVSLLPAVSIFEAPANRGREQELFPVGAFAVRAQAERLENIVLSASKDANERNTTLAPDADKIILSADLTDAVG